MQRLQGLEVKKYKYTEQWRQVRGIEDIEVRGVIAQDVAEKFPEYVRTSSFSASGCHVEDFKEVKGRVSWHSRRRQRKV